MWSWLEARSAAPLLRLAAWDLQAARWCHRGVDHAALAGALAVASRLGDGMVWYLVIAALPFADPSGGLRLALGMLALGTVNLLLYQAMKRRICRTRPCHGADGFRAAGRVLDRYSFPSGHVLHAVSYAVLLSAAHPAAGPWLWGFAVLVAASRVVLGLHYPGDVLAGAALGACTAGIALQGLASTGAVLAGG